MCRKSFCSLVFLTFFLACTPSKERAVAEELPTEQPTRTMDNWGNFWKTFTVAVSQNDFEKVVSMTQMPLANNLEEGGWSKEKMQQQFANLFDETTRTKFLEATGRDIRAMPSGGQIPGLANIPAGIELKTIQVAYETGRDADARSGPAKVFIFGEIDGRYQLLSVLFAG